MNAIVRANPPLRILLAALGGEGGGVLMNWIVKAARDAGMTAQATSVPGVAQRTGSTSYYIEIADPADGPSPVLGLVPMPGRVDLVLASELVEAARAIDAGFVSPKLTTLISSTSRVLTTAEKAVMGDGRYADDGVVRAAEELAREVYLVDLAGMASENGTFISATMFGALAGSDVLPWPRQISRDALGTGRSAEASLRGFDAACAAVEAIRVEGVVPADKPGDAAAAESTFGSVVNDLPECMHEVATHGYERCVDYQDTRYGDLFLARVGRLAGSIRHRDHLCDHALQEACRRLALWMAYEDVARVADLKTRQERFDRIREEVGLKPGQILQVTEYLKPRAEEIADILPAPIGARMIRRVDRGGRFSLIGRGVHIRSNGIFGYWMLRSVAALKRLRRRSYRFEHEQSAMEDWLDDMATSLQRSPAFAAALAELPRVLKGYSDTLARGKAAYTKITQSVVRPALVAGTETASADLLRQAVAAALADEDHAALDSLLASVDSRAAQTMESADAG